MFGWCLLEACSFLKGDGRGVDTGDGEELGGVEGGDIVEMCCTGEELIFS